MPRPPRLLSVGAAIVLILAHALGCRSGPPGPSEPRLVVLYATCSLSRHYLGPYNPEVAYTPALSAFGEEATVFLRHHTETGQSGVAFASLLTGTQADQHGVFSHPSPLRDDASLIAEAFLEAGYDTHSWSGHLMATPDLNYGQGIRTEHIDLGEEIPADATLTANDGGFETILHRLRRDPSYRAYVQVLFTVTHAPYTRIEGADVDRFREAYPDEWPDLTTRERVRSSRRYRGHRHRLERDLPALVRERGWEEEDVLALARYLDGYYKANVHALDTWFGQFIQSIRDADLLDESLIVFTADHGETLHRKHTIFKWSHGLQLSPDVIQVPLIVRAPRLGRRTYESVTRSIDVHPTLLGLAGLTPGQDVAGTDLSAAILGDAPAPSLQAFSHTMPLTPQLLHTYRGLLVTRLHPSADADQMWTAVRDRDTYVRRRRELGGAWTTEAFDLAVDPGASRDIFDGGNPTHASLEEALAAYKARLVARHGEPGSAEPLSEDEVEDRLRALGYIE